MTGVKKANQTFSSAKLGGLFHRERNGAMAISELGSTKIGCVNGLGNSLHFPQCFQDRPVVNSVKIRLTRYRRLEQMNKLTFDTFRHQGSAPVYPSQACWIYRFLCAAFALPSSAFRFFQIIRNRYPNHGSAS